MLTALKAKRSNDDGKSIKQSTNISPLSIIFR